MKNLNYFAYKQIRFNLNDLRGMKRKLILAFVFCLSLLSLQAAEVETVDSLLDQDIVLNSAVEYHITNASHALTNSSVDLTDENSMLVFDNIRPSDVVSKYKSSIKINGAILAPGTNGRVAIYKLGTAILPHGSNFKPLTVFTEPDFAGESSSYQIQTYYRNLGAFDNAIKSFKLKKGYMATFANTSDGSGYSRVFIADTEDLEMNMPGLLSGKASFIRVFKHEWVTKKGKAGWNPDEINSTSYYDWNIGGSSSYDHEYAAIRQNAGWPSWDAINNKENISHLLGFNEPDRPDQADMPFDDMIAQWPNFMKSGLRLGSPAWSSEWNGAPDGGGNLFDFIEKCDELNYRVDFVALHCYWAKSPQSWYNDLKYIHDRTGRPLWITEWNNGANWTTESWPSGNRNYTPANAEKQLNDMKKILEVLDTASFVERYFIYDWVEDCRAMVLNGGLTLAGEYYYNNPSEIAYTAKNKVIPHWNAQAPVFRTLTSIPALRKHLLQWNDPNKELTNEISIERKINEGDYEEVYSTTNTSTAIYQAPYEDGVQGTIQFRIKCTVANGTVKYSQPRSVSLTAGQDSIQVANFLVSNFSDQTCAFPRSYTNDPSVLLGPLSFRNGSVQLAKRISDVDKDKVDMRIETWNFQKNDFDNIENKPETVSFLALPDGNYDMEGIAAEVNKVETVNTTWKAVTFNQPFATKPVVFATQITDRNTVPTSVRITNVTTTGFMVRLQKEEAQTGSTLNENICYFAATEGTGVLDKKRLTVGHGSREIGGLTKQLKIFVDESYTDVAFFAALQTTHDDITASLRYYNEGINKRIFKQRETSVSSINMQTDEVGYMLIDLAPGQFAPVRKVSSKLISVYPNPVNDVLYFDMDGTAQVEVYDLTGNKVASKLVTKQFNVEELNPGIYLMFIDGKAHSKFLKR